MVMQRCDATAVIVQLDKFCAKKPISQRYCRVDFYSNELRKDKYCKSVVIDEAVVRNVSGMILWRIVSLNVSLTSYLEVELILVIQLGPEA